MRRESLELLNDLIIAKQETYEALKKEFIEVGLPDIVRRMAIEMRKELSNIPLGEFNPNRGHTAQVSVQRTLPFGAEDVLKQAIRNISEHLVIRSVTCGRHLHGYSVCVDFALAPLD